MTRPATLRPLYFYTALDAYRAREGSELARAGAPTDRGARGQRPTLSGFKTLSYSDM
jgi:hypothetical protein